MIDKDPYRLIKDRCEFCGYSVGLRWNDCCCERQHQKFLVELAEQKRVDEEHRVLAQEYDMHLGIRLGEA